MHITAQKEFVDAQVAIFRNTDRSENVLLNKHKIVIELLKKYSRADDRILDIGCSDGKILKELEKLGYKKLFGIDIQEWSNTALLGTQVDYKMCDIEKERIPFRGKFDVIIFTDVLEHLFSPNTVLFDVRSYLSENGKIIFCYPNAGWFFNGILLTFFPSKLFISTAFGPWGHTHQFTFYETKQIAKRLCYKILQLRGGKMDNYAFKAGLKKVIYDLFVELSIGMIKYWPSVFSAHIFGVFVKTKRNPSLQSRFDLGID